MKNELYFVLKAADKGLSQEIKDFEEELECLDPSATIELQFILARLKGVADYMEGRLRTYEQALHA